MPDLNYIIEINSFYDWLETNPISDSSIVLWHALMHINNKCGWKTEFAVAISTIELKTGLSKSSIIRSRNALQQVGRIKFKSREGQQSALYTIVPFHREAKSSTQSNSKNDFACHTDTQSGTQTVTQSDTQSGTQTVPIPKLKETKPNSNTVVPASPAPPIKNTDDEKDGLQGFIQNMQADNEPALQTQNPKPGTDAKNSNANFQAMGQTVPPKSERLEPKKKIAPKNKKEPRPHWQPIVDAWQVFYQDKKKEPFEMLDEDYKHLGLIYDMLRRRAERKGSEWSESYMLEVFTYFLKKAYGVNWLQLNFSLLNVLRQFNQIINGTADQPKPIINGQQSKSERVTAGQQALANRLSGKTARQ